jgi:hypothetical protein
MLYLPLLYLVVPSVAVATVMLLVNAAISRAVTRRMFDTRPRPVVRPLTLPLPAPADSGVTELDDLDVLSASGSFRFAAV